MSFAFDDLKADYEQNIAAMRLTRAADVTRLARHLVSIMGRYSDVSKETKIPAVWLACIDYRESDNNPRTYLGNGDPIIGRNRKTTDVPRNRGPFSTWQAGALDALAYMHLENLPDAWTLTYAIWEAERWNGFGAREHGTPSGYLWAGTSIYRGGGYPEDGEWDPKHIDKELGVVPLLVTLGRIEPSLALSA